MYRGKVKGITIRLGNKAYANMVKRFNPKLAKDSGDGELTIKISCYLCVQREMNCQTCPLKSLSVLFEEGWLGCLAGIWAVGGEKLYDKLNVGDQRLSWKSEDNEVIKAGMKKIQRVLKKFKKEEEV